MRNYRPRLESVLDAIATWPCWGAGPERPDWRRPPQEDWARRRAIKFRSRGPNLTGTDGASDTSHSSEPSSGDARDGQPAGDVLNYRGPGADRGTCTDGYPLAQCGTCADAHPITDRHPPDTAASGEMET